MSFGESRYTPPTNPRLRSLDKPTKAVPDSCSRCGGAGGYVGWPGFTCFRCAGTGQDPSSKVWAFPTDWTDSQISEFHAEREAKNAHARERAQAKREAEREAQRNEALTYNVTTYPELAPLLDRHKANRIEDSFIADVLDKADQFPLTSAQAAAVIKATAEFDATIQRIESTPDLPEGTYALMGRVVSIKWVDSQWGTQQKMLVELDDGQRVFGTVPVAIENVVANDRVRFDATVSRSADDRLFGFFKRPRNAQIVERADATDTT